MTEGGHRICETYLDALGVSCLNLGSGIHLARDYGDPAMLYVDADKPPADRATEAEGFPGLSIVDGEFFYTRMAVPPLDVDDHSVDYVLCEHMIEHLPRESGLVLAREILRVLKPGGVLRVSTPDLELYCRQAFARGVRARRFRASRAARLSELAHDIPDLRVLAAPDGVVSRALLVNQVFSCWGHCWIYDFDDLATLLRTAGFATVRRRRFRKGVGRLARWDNAYRRDESLYVEARRSA